MAQYDYGTNREKDKIAQAQSQVRQMSYWNS